MEKSEPSLVPEWLKNPGGGNSSHHFAVSDDTSLASSKHHRNSRNSNNTNGPYSSFIDRNSSRRTLNNNGLNRHDRHVHARSYSGNSRNQHKDQGRLDEDTWDKEFSDSLNSLVDERIHNGTLRRSQSMISSRPRELSQRKPFIDTRNKSHSINNNVNGAGFVASDSSDIKKVPSERDFPLLGFDERPLITDIARIASPRLSRGAHGLPIGTSSLSSDGWTSALAEVPTVAGSTILSPSSMEPPHYGASVSTSNGARASNGHNVSGALEQVPSRSQYNSLKLEDLPSMGSKRLIPMTPSTPKTSVLNPSDMLKPKAAMKSSETLLGLSNGLQHASSSQLGSQPVRARVDGQKSGKVLLPKSTRESVLPLCQAINAPSAIANGRSACASSATVPLKVTQNMKLVDKRVSLEQLRSRNDFFNLVRKKSMSNTSVGADSSTVSCDGQNSDEGKEIASGPTEIGGEVKCNDIGDDCSLGKSKSDLSNDADSPNAEEEAFLRSLGWEENSTGVEDALTEEEINAFVQKVSQLKITAQSDDMKWKSSSKLWQDLQLKIVAHLDPQA